MTGDSLSVRQFERHRCNCPAQAWVAENSAAAVRLAHAGPVPIQVIDYGRGGLGLQGPVYFPPACRLRLEIALPEGGPCPVRVRVQRVVMADFTPTYVLGTAFEEADEPTLERLARGLAGPASRHASSAGPGISEGRLSGA